MIIFLEITGNSRRRYPPRQATVEAEVSDNIPSAAPIINGRLYKIGQIGTLMALRLTNSGDQSIVKSSAPDNLNSLINLLPSLRIGEAVIVGESIKIPSRVRIRLNSPRPTSDDPKLVEAWSKSHKVNKDNYKTVVKIG